MLIKCYCFLSSLISYLLDKGLLWQILKSGKVLAVWWCHLDPLLLAVEFQIPISQLTGLFGGYRGERGSQTPGTGSRVAMYNERKLYLENTARNNGFLHQIPLFCSF